VFASASRKLIPILTTSPMKVRAVASRGRTEETVCNNAHLPYELPAPTMPRRIGIAIVLR
jgi:hypothetical protein